MHHALIENGVVVQLDLTGNPPDGYVECPDYVQPGFTFDENQFHPPEVPEPEPTLPAPSELVMSGSGLRADGFMLSTDVAGYNYGGGFVDAPGVFTIFPLQEVTGPIDCWFSVGGGFTMIGQLLDPYMIRVEARDMNGNLANPERFSMRIYQP